MSHLSFTSALTLAVSLSVLGIGCGSDQKNVNSAENPPPADQAQPGGDMTPPNGEPTNTPPAAPTPAPGAAPEGRNDTSTSNSLGMPGSASAPAVTPLTEGQVAMITELANTAEIEQGKLAQNKAKNASVRKFAAMMVKDHTDAKAKQAKLYQSLKVTSTQSQDAIVLRDSADKTLGSLRSATGDAFDLAYIEAQVDEHKQLLDKIDQQLMPAAADQPLIDELKNTRAIVESHLNEAKTILQDLDKNRAH